MFEDLASKELASRYTSHQAERGRKALSFQVVRHEHPNIFVVNRQTYETYRFTVDDNVVPAFGAPSDLTEARRTAAAFLAQNKHTRA
jgi:hypothetical protein